MAEKQNPGYIEQLKEMRALRTQQLRGMNADQRFYANLNANQRALVQANQKLAASFDSMSRTFVSSIRGLTSAVGGIASKGASAAGNVAGGAASLAGSITSGLGKVLPFAIAGLVGKMLLWDNLNNENKNRLTSSVTGLFSNLFGGLPDMFKGVIQKIVNSVSEMDIKFPIIGTLMEKTEAFIKIFSAGIELAKLKFEDLMEFFGNIKDPMKLFESSLKAVGGATLARLLLPATVSLITSIIGNRLLMGQIGGILDSRGGGGGRGSTIVGPAGGRSNKPRKPGTGTGGGAKAGLAAAARLGLRAGSTSLALAIPVFNILALSYTAYELYQIAQDLGLTEDEARELSQYEETGQTKAATYLETRTSNENYQLEKLTKERNDNAAILEKSTGTSREDVLFRAELIKKQADLAEKINPLAAKSRINKDLEQRQARKEVFERFYSIWNILERDEKLYAIEQGIPIVETENFVYFMGKDRKTIEKKPVDQYLKELRDLPEIQQMDREEFQNKLASVIKPPESGAAGYNAFFGQGSKKLGSIPPPKDITKMTGQEVLDYQEQLRESTKAAGQGKINGVVYGTSAVGAYQIVRQNLTNAKKKGYFDENPEEKNKLFDEEQQDKIYRSLISGAVDQYMRTGDKAAFEKYVVDTWDAFKPEGSDARKQLQALLNNPTFTEGAGEPTNKLNKEQRAAREKMLVGIVGQGFKDILKPGDTTIATIKGESVIEKGVQRVENVAESFTEKLRGIFGRTGTAEDFLSSSQGPKFEDVLKLFGNPSSKPPITIINNDNKSSSSSSYTGSAGSAMTNNVISKAPYNNYTQFSSLAGGMPQT
jgi:hypothetical protein